MTVSQLIELLSTLDGQAKAEFVYHGQHYKILGAIPYDVSGWNSVEIFGKELNSTEDW